MLCHMIHYIMRAKLECGEYYPVYIQGNIPPPPLYNVSCDKIHVLVWPVWPPLSADEIKTGRIFAFYCL